MIRDKERLENKCSFFISNQCYIKTIQIVVFEIRYKPGYHLKVRMGIHCGPCVAGLVGTILPSYALVGEAVENAKLMEATGEPMKIQVIITNYKHFPFSFSLNSQYNLISRNKTFYR